MKKEDGKLENHTSLKLRGILAKPRVAVAMSGGVDSSVAAKILKDQGYDVVGFMMKLWSDETSCGTRENACCDEQGVADARKVADQLGISFYLVDARKEFKKEVADYFINEFKNLRTPNPCVVCNEKIKFGWLLDFAKKAGCEFLATGHYARVASASESPITKRQLSVNNQSSKSNDQNLKRINELTNQPVNFHLFVGKDENKDQTYFLYRLNQDQLKRIIFPVGEYTKEEVRAMAKKWNLPVHQKVESQEICFIHDKDIRDFLRRNIPKELFIPGEIVDKAGNIIGKHEGLINYTIGQRRGIDQNPKSEIRNPKQILNSKSKKEKQPLYVVGFDRKKNRLIVGEDKEVYQNKMTIENVHFIQNTDNRIQITDNLKVKIRYRHEAVACAMTKIQNTKYKIQFDQPQRAVTPGQSAVFYAGDEVIGGGIIE